MNDDDDDDDDEHALVHLTFSCGTFVSVHDAFQEYKIRSDSTNI